MAAEQRVPCSTSVKSMHHPAAALLSIVASLWAQFDLDKRLIQARTHAGAQSGVSASWPKNKHFTLPSPACPRSFCVVRHHVSLHTLLLVGALVFYIGGARTLPQHGRGGSGCQSGAPSMDLSLKYSLGMLGRIIITPCLLPTHTGNQWKQINF